MRTFVEMRRFMLSNAEMFKRIDSLEIRQLKTDQKVDAVLDAIGSQELEPKQGVFFDGQIFDAYSFVSKLVRKAKTSIVLIDNYVDDSVLTLLSKRRKASPQRCFPGVRSPPRPSILQVVEHIRRHKRDSVLRCLY